MSRISLFLLGVFFTTQSALAVGQTCIPVSKKVTNSCGRVDATCPTDHPVYQSGSGGCSPNHCEPGGNGLIGNVVKDSSKKEIGYFCWGNSTTNLFQDPDMTVTISCCTAPVAAAPPPAPPAPLPAYGTTETATPKPAPPPAPAPAPTPSQVTQAEPEPAPAATQPASSDSGEQQARSYEKAATEDFTGAVQAAQLAVRCQAEGANMMLVDRAMGGFQANECFKAMEAAEEMRALAEKNGTLAKGADSFSNDELATAVTTATQNDRVLDEFATSYNFAREEFVKRAVNHPGSKAAFADALKARLSQMETLKALEMGKTLSEEDKQLILARLEAQARKGENVYRPGGKGTARSIARDTGSAMRDALRESLRDKGAVETANTEKSSDKASSKKQKIGSLSPLKDPLFSQPEAAKEPSQQAQNEVKGSDELSLFDLMHQKYRGGRIEKRMSRDL